MGCMEALAAARRAGWARVWLESDSEDLVQAVNIMEDDDVPWHILHIIKDIRELKTTFTSFVCSSIKRKNR